MNPLSRPFENILITTVDDGPFFVDELFLRKFAHPAPDHGISVICFYRNSENYFLPVCYTNFLPYEGVMLAGGGMTDGRAFEQMPADLSEKIRASGGVFFHLLRFAFDRFKDQCEAYFGHVGDPRSYEVVIPAGFEQTKHKHLLANFHKPLTTERKDYLIEKIHGIGPF
jgi:hypothetical protein